eukprot:scaffold599961_cov46-Prasinocladus_malaysianus.AAC.1
MSSLTVFRCHIRFGSLADVLVLAHPDDARELMAAEGRAHIRPGVGLTPTIQLLHGEKNLQSLEGKEHQRWRKVLIGILSPRELEGFLPHILEALRGMWAKMAAAPPEVIRTLNPIDASH